MLDFRHKKEIWKYDNMKGLKYENMKGWKDENMKTPI